MNLAARLVVGLAGTGLAVWLAFFMPITDGMESFLVRHHRLDDLLLVVLLLLAVSGWIVAVAA